MRNIIEAVLIVGICSLLYLLGFYSGEKSKQDEIKNRAKEIKTKTVTQQQLEIIIFNESQL